MQEENIKRCKWAVGEYNIPYHDNQWGKQEHDDLKLFEFLILEGMQAGLSWEIILKKRESMASAFDGFDYDKIITYDERKLEQLMQNEKIIRNKRKLNALIENAKSFKRVQAEFGSFDAYIWKFVDYKQIRNLVDDEHPIKANSELSDLISKDMKKRGFKFVGTTIIYSYLQAIGIINDHEVSCDFR